jgi:hypothetical protein
MAFIGVLGLYIISTFGACIQSDGHITMHQRGTGVRQPSKARTMMVISIFFYLHQKKDIIRSQLDWLMGWADRWIFLSTSFFSSSFYWVSLLTNGFGAA